MKKAVLITLALLVSVWGISLPSAEADGQEPPLPILIPEAGPDKTINEGETVVFDGSGSQVINGTLDEYYWDFHADEDSDSDGNYTNDKDAIGAIVSHSFGDDGDYEITLTIGSKVEGQNESLVAQDTVFVIDSSGSMDWNDPSELRQQAAESYLYLMSDNDTATVTVFGDYSPPGGPYCSYAAWLVYDTHLTLTDASGKAKIKNSIDYTRFADGGTNIEKALQVAHQEILPGYIPSPTELRDCSPSFPSPGGNGRANHAWIEILLTDGKPSHSLSATDDEVRVATYAGIRVFTIGLGAGVDEDYLRDIAYETGGRYYFAPNASDLQEIYNNISKVVKTIIGGTIYASDSLTVHVENVPPQLTLSAGVLANEGKEMSFWANVTDPGSDDIHLLFEWGDWTSNETSEHLNAPPNPDPYPSPEVNPRSVSEHMKHTFGDNWGYGVTVRVWDDDGGNMSASLMADVQNTPPELSVDIPSSTDEGIALAMSAYAADDGSDDLKFSWSFGDGSSSNMTYYNDGSGPDPLPSPWGLYPFSATDNQVHTWGDNGVYDVTVKVEDDDGGWSTATVTLAVANVVPQIYVPPDLVFDEGTPFVLTAEATDPGSDDLEFEWVLELGPSQTTIYYNDGLEPDPDQSPWGEFPFVVTDALQSVYGDDGSYKVALTVMDDDGGEASTSFEIEIRNLAPEVSTGGPYVGLENLEIEFEVTATDPGSDDITIIWDWGDGTTDMITFRNLAFMRDPPKSPWGTYPFTVTHSMSHIWGDNGNFTVTLTVMDDDGGITLAPIVAAVGNVAPTIVNYSFDVYFNVPRTQGYWNFQCTWKLPSPDHVGIRQEYIDYISSSSLIFAGISAEDEVCDYLRDVDGDNMTQKALQQLMALWLNIAAGFMKTYSQLDIPQLNMEIEILEFMVWIEDIILHDPDNMELAKDLADGINNGMYLPYAVLSASSTAKDQGSDDLIFTWVWGDGEQTVNTYYNNGLGPDPYPSAEINPIVVTDTANHSYWSPGDYVIKLYVTDDDGGMTILDIPLSALSVHLQLYFWPLCVQAPGYPIPTGIQSDTGIDRFEARL